MTEVNPEAVAHLARLAALDLPAEDMSALVEEITRILDYVSAITAVTGDAPSGRRSWQTGAPPPARVDRASPAHPPLVIEAFAPETASGYVLVPRLEVRNDR